MSVLPCAEGLVPARVVVWDWCYWRLACMFFCRDVYSAAVYWRGVYFVCVLLFCIVDIDGVEYGVLEVKYYFFHLFISLVCTVNMEFFRDLHYVCPFGLLV
jgi:hypothetical protein